MCEAAHAMHANVEQKDCWGAVLTTVLTLDRMHDLEVMSWIIRHQDGRNPPIRSSGSDAAGRRFSCSVAAISSSCCAAACLCCTVSPYLRRRPNPHMRPTSSSANRQQCVQRLYDSCTTMPCPTEDSRG